MEFIVWLFKHIHNHTAWSPDRNRSSNCGSSFVEVLSPYKIDIFRAISLILTGEQEADADVHAEPWGRYSDCELCANDSWTSMRPFVASKN